MSPRPHNRPSKNGIRREDFLQKIPKTGVDVHPLSVNLFVLPEAGAPSLWSAFYVHFGTANWNSILSRFYRAVAFGEGGQKIGNKVEFFCRRKCTLTAGSLTSTHRVVRKYNFKS